MSSYKTGLQNRDSGAIKKYRKIAKPHICGGRIREGQGVLKKQGHGLGQVRLQKTDLKAATQLSQ